jgi:hypothetical protein
MHRRTAFAAVAVITLAAAAPAHAVGELPAPHGGLFLAVAGDGNTWMRGVLLRCEPAPAGPHPDAAAACEALDAAGGDPGRLPGSPHPCTKEYDPVTAHAAGEWRGRPTVWHKTYANACELDAETGVVFRF